MQAYIGEAEGNVSMQAYIGEAAGKSTAQPATLFTESDPRPA
jgi:hypothetical protein